MVSAAPELRRRALRQLGELLVALVVVIGCAGVVLFTVVSSFGYSRGGALHVCIQSEAPPGVAEWFSVDGHSQWLPLGIGCEWYDGDGWVTDEPSWGATGVVAAAVLLGGGTVGGFIRYEKHRTA